MSAFNNAGFSIYSDSLMRFATDWANPATLGPLGVPGKVITSLFHSASSRTTGFNTVDTAAMHPETWAVTDVLMFIGGLVAAGTTGLLMMTDEPLDLVLFESVSAFATVGLSAGITADLPAGAQLILIVLMFVGRVGTITVGSALALRASHRLYRYPEERPIVG